MITYCMFIFDQISYGHVSVMGYPSTNDTALVLADTRRSEFDFFVYGGLTEVFGCFSVATITNYILRVEFC